MYAYTHLQMYKYLNLCIYVSFYTCECLYICRYVFIYSYIHSRTYTCERVYESFNQFMYLPVYACTCTHTHTHSLSLSLTHTHTHTSSAAPYALILLRSLFYTHSVYGGYLPFTPRFCCYVFEKDMNRDLLKRSTQMKRHQKESPALCSRVTNLTRTCTCHPDI